MKIAFINHKGGIGKTTLAVNTAFRSLELKRKLLLLDFDEQKNSMQLFSGYCWSNEPMYNEDDYIWLVNGNVGRINCNWSEFDNILFDCPPSYLSADSFMNFLQNHNLSVDLWVVPVESRTSISGATTVTSKIRQYYPNSRILIVLNRCASGEITQADRMEIARFPNIELSKIIIPASKTGLHKLSVVLFNFPIKTNLPLLFCFLCSAGNWFDFDHFLKYSSFIISLVK